MAATEERVKKDFKDFATTAASWWCPGCGDFGVLAALQRALANLGFENEEVVVVAGIGCSGKIGGYVKAYGFHGLHGRALPPATAIKLANKGMKVIVAGGDGDGYGIGAGHFIHAVRRNVDLTYIVMDNSVYGLTKGQVSPTSNIGFVTPTTPTGSVESPVNPLALYLSSGGTFLAQGFSGDVKGLTEMIEDGIQHPGFSLINTFSPCVTYNKEQTYAFYRQHLVDINGEEVEHDPTDLKKAMMIALDKKPWAGVIYRNTDRPSYHEQLPGLAGDPLSKMDLERLDVDYTKILAEFQ